MVGYCIAHNPLLFQPLRHWLTFVYRKCEHLAVGSSGRGLTRSRGHPHFVVASPSPVVPLLYHNSGDLSRGFFNFFIPSGDDSAGISRKGEPVSTQSPMGAISFPLRWLLTASLLTMIVYHRLHQKSMGNVAQIRDFI